ncbi:MAG: peptide chain release factor-like protein [Chlamydiae bacterium]|nr:peptide chain release factor-like protein [Chlamydiota bacterium]
MIRKEKQEELQKRMELLGIKEEDLLEKFVLGSGKGGQKVNKTSSCVYLKHLPSEIEVKCQKDRSREMNRFFARRELCDQLEEKAGGVTKKQKEIEKIRKQKQRRARKAKVKTEEVSD